MTGGRIKFAEKYLEGERSLATSGDGDRKCLHSATPKASRLAGALAAPSTTSLKSRFEVVRSDERGLVKELLKKPQGSEVIYTGNFIMGPEIFEYLRQN